MTKIYKVEATKPLIKALIYGKPGSGKTLLAATAMDHEDLKDVLFINVEGGLLTIADKQPFAVNIGRNDDGTPNGKIVDDLEKVIWAIVGKKPGYENIRTVVLDSASELQTIDLEDVVREDGKHDIDDRVVKDYGKDSARLKRIFRMLKDIKCNIIFTAIIKSTMSDIGKITEVAPSLTNKVAEALMGYVDFVWYLYKDDNEVRYLLTHEKGPIRAKTRNKKFADAIGGKVTNPDLPTLYNKLCEVMK